MGDLYKAASSKKNLHKAWRVIEANAIQSRSAYTRNEVREFNKSLWGNIESISHRLARGKFKFEKSLGVKKKRKNKAPRPIVAATPTNKMVQRTILDILQGIPALNPIFNTPYSYGAIEDKSVPDAIKDIQAKIALDGQVYLKSDISDFFCGIRREEVIEAIRSKVDDPRLVALFDAAIQTELSNMDELGAFAEEFPLYEVGVAQGNCLSPLVGNILLNDFDRITNTEDVTCFRFIDDFILIGPSEKAVRAVHKKGIQELKRLGLRAYEPGDSSGKSKIGRVVDGFEFLGCFVTDSIAKPSKNGIQRFKKNIRDVLVGSLDLTQNPDKIQKLKRSEADVLKLVSDMFKGWWGQYRTFCTDTELYGNLERDIEQMVTNYQTKMRKIRDRADVPTRAKLIGIAPVFKEEAK